MCFRVYTVYKSEILDNKCVDWEERNGITFCNVLIHEMLKSSLRYRM